MLREEFVVPLGLTQTDLAHRLGISFPRLNEILNEKRAVTPDTALRLERLLGMDADFWLSLQMHWDLWQAKHGDAAGEIAKVKSLKKQLA